MLELEIDNKTVMIENASSAVRSIIKNSKLREHYINLAKMNNVMRAFITTYHLSSEHKLKQEQLLDTLCTVEARKNRAWFTIDKIRIQEALSVYVQILESSSNEQIQEIISFVDKHNTDGKWLIHKNK